MLFPRFDSFDFFVPQEKTQFLSGIFVHGFLAQHLGVCNVS